MNIFLFPRRGFPRWFLAVSRALFWTTVLVQVSKPAWAGEAVDEIARVVPRDMAVCLVVEDLARHYQQARASESGRRLAELPVFTLWRQSAAYRKILAVDLPLRTFLGLGIEELRDQIFGDAVVLAFRPGSRPGKDDVGLLFVRTRTPETLANLIARITRPLLGMPWEERQHRGVTYHWAQGARGQNLGIVRLGRVGIVGDKEAALHQVIDAEHDHTGIAREPLFQEIERALPTGCFLRVVLNPRPFDAHLASAPASANHAEMALQHVLRQAWRDTRWTAFSLRVEPQRLALGWHWALQPGEKNSPSISSLGKVDGFWRSLPVDTWAAMAWPCDLQVAAQFMTELTEPAKRQELQLAIDVLQQLFMGLEWREEILASFGPDVGVALIPGMEPNTPAFVAWARLAQPWKRDDLGLQFVDALEWGLRPLLVALTFEHNKDHQDQLRVQTRRDHGTRLHFLSGSRHVPGWFQPGYALWDNRLLIFHSPSAFAALVRFAHVPTTHTLASHTLLRDERSQNAPNYEPRGFIHVRAFRDAARAKQELLLTNWSDTRPQQRARVAAILTHAIAIADLFEAVVLGVHETTSPPSATPASERVRHWTLSLRLTYPVQ